MQKNLSLRYLKLRMVSIEVRTTCIPFGQDVTKYHLTEGYACVANEKKG